MGYSRLDTGFDVIYNNSRKILWGKGTENVKNKIPNLMVHVVEDLWRIKMPMILIVVYMTTGEILFGKICPLRLLTGFPCPGCGLTRAGLLVLMGEWFEAAEMNLTIFLWIPLLMYLFSARYLFPKLKRFIPAVLIPVCIFTMVYYIMRMVLVFPGEPVMYARENLLTVFICK